MWEAFEHAALLRARQPDRDHRRQPPRPARRDDARLGPRLLRRPSARRSAGTRSRSTATTSRRSTARTPRRSTTTGKPTVIVAQDDQGQGRAEVENKAGWHGKALDNPERGDRGARRRARTSSSSVAKPDAAGEPHVFEYRAARAADATSSARRSRRARPTARRSPRWARRDGKVVALDGEVSNSTYAEIFAQGAIRSATSRCSSPSSRWSQRRSACRCAGWVPFASTFAAFFSRAYDFVRMAAISQANICLSRLARRRLDRRGRAVADGARGPRDDARRPRLDGALSL